MMTILSRAMRRYTWAMMLPLVALAAWLSARGVSNLVGSALAATAEELAYRPAVVAPSAAPRVDTRTAEAIMRRNPFSSDDAPKALVPDDGRQVLPSCAALRVRAIVASSEPDYSFASIHSSEGPSLLRRRGGKVADKEVTFIASDRVWLRNADGSLCQILLGGSEQPGTSGPETGPPLAPSAPLDSAIAGGIKRLDANRFAIDRGALEMIIEKQELFKNTPIVPKRGASGAVTAMRVLKVPPQSLLDTIGIKSGDDLQTINGFDITDPEKALTAYAHLRTAPKLWIGLERDGKKLQIDYEIR